MFRAEEYEHIDTIEVLEEDGQWKAARVLRRLAQREHPMGPTLKVVLWFGKLEYEGLGDSAVEYNRNQDGSITLADADKDSIEAREIKLTVGSRVRGLWPGTQEWYQGAITLVEQVKHDQLKERYQVQFDDGDTATLARPNIMAVCQVKHRVEVPGNPAAANKESKDAPTNPEPPQKECSNPNPNHVVEVTGNPAAANQKSKDAPEPRTAVEATKPNPNPNPPKSNNKTPDPPNPKDLLAALQAACETLQPEHLAEVQAACPKARALANPDLQAEDQEQLEDAAADTDWDDDLGAEDGNANPRPNTPAPKVLTLVELAANNAALEAKNAALMVQVAKLEAAVKQIAATKVATIQTRTRTLTHNGNLCTHTHTHTHTRSHPPTRLRPTKSRSVRPRWLRRTKSRSVRPRWPSPRPRAQRLKRGRGKRRRRSGLGLVRVTGARGRHRRRRSG